MYTLNTLCCFGVVLVVGDGVVAITLNIYSKTCLKRSLKYRQNTDLNDKWKLNEGRKNCRMLQGEHSAILLTCIER